MSSPARFAKQGAAASVNVCCPFVNNPIWGAFIQTVCQFSITLKWPQRWANKTREWVTQLIVPIVKQCWILTDKKRQNGQRCWSAFEYDPNNSSAVGSKKNKQEKQKPADVHKISRCESLQLNDCRQAITGKGHVYWVRLKPCLDCKT